MNIIIEDNIDFYEQLNMSDSDDEADDCCLLTKSRLDKNKISLPCNHSFNFIPLYKEICIQKMGASNLETDFLMYNQIKCPYCRQKFDFLLPHVRLNKSVTYISGVNTPQQLCMSFHKCSYVFSNGKNKNTQCSKTGYYENDQCYCTTHHNMCAKRSAVIPKCKRVKAQTVICKCKAILKNGKRAGQECSAQVLDGQNNIYCKRHSSAYDVV